MSMLYAQPMEDARLALVHYCSTTAH